MRRLLHPSIVLLFALSGLAAAYAGSGADDAPGGVAPDFVGVLASATTSTTTEPSTTKSTTSTTSSTTTSTVAPTSTTTTVPPTAAPAKGVTQSTTSTTAPVAPTPTTTTAPPPPSTTTTTIAPYADAGAASQHVTLVNQARVANRLPALSSSSALATAALDWARQLAARGSLAHSNLGRIGGFAWRAENVGTGPPSATVIHQLWMGSDGHRDNILSSKATAAGAGVWVDAGGRAWHVLVLGG